MGSFKEEEIWRLRELNLLLMKDVKNLRQEKAGFLQKLTQMESDIEEFQSKINNLHGELTEQAKVAQHLKEDQKEFREQCQKKSEEYRAAISKQLQEAEEIFKKEIFEKEKECRAVVSDKRILESTVLQLNCEIQLISEVLETAHKGWKLEKDKLSSQIAAARQETEELAKGNQMAEQAWNTEKENLLSSLFSHKKKIEEMSLENERLLVQSRAENDDKQSMSNELVEDKHFLISEYGNMKSQIAELQTKVDSIASERGMLRQKNGEEEEGRTSRLIETQNQRVEEVETALHSVKEDLERKDLQSLQEEDLECKELQFLQARSVIIEDGKSKSNNLLENIKLKRKLILESKDGKSNGFNESTKPKSNVVIEMRKSNGLQGRATSLVQEKRTSAKPLSENRTPLKLIPQKQTPNKLPAKRTPSSLTPEKKTPNKEPENRTLSKLTPGKQTPNKAPSKPTPKQLSQKQSPNIRPEKPWR